MYRPKKHVRLTALPHTPQLKDVEVVHDEARKARGCTVELPWRNKRTEMSYSLTVRVELAGGDPVWTLYEGDEEASRVVWSSSFEDVELLFDVLTLSIPEEVENTDLSQDPYPSTMVESAQHTRKTGTKTPSYPEKPPGYYDSGLLKEEDLEVYKQKQEKEEAEKKEAEKKEQAKPKEPEKKEKPEPEPSSQSGVHPQATHSGAYPQQSNQSGAYPAQYPPQQAPSNQSGAYPAQYPPQQAPSNQSGAYPAPYPPQQAPSNQSGAYPAPHHIPQGYQFPPPPGYPYPPPGYPYQPYPPSGYNQYPAQNVAGSVSVEPGSVPPSQVDRGESKSADPESGSRPKKNQPNVRLGRFLVEAGIVPQSTVDAALQLQDLVRTGALPTIKAAEAVRRAHVRGGQVDPKLTKIVTDEETQSVVAPPLGQILVEAAILRGPVLKSALALQKKVRASDISKGDAIDQLCEEVFGVGSKRSTSVSESKESIKAVELLKSIGLLSEFDLDTASKVKDKHGGRLVSILERAGKIDSLTVDAALKCVTLMKVEKLNLDKAAIALHYCQRSRVSLEDALKELGWKKSVLGVADDEEVEVVVGELEEE